MRFLMIRKADANTEAGVMPSEELLETMAKYHEEMMAAGIFRGGEGLKPSAQGARVTFTKGRPTVIDGPFAEAKELVAGYSVIEVASREEAIAWAKRWPATGLEENVTIEIRPVYVMSDFGESEGVAHHERIFARVAEQEAARR